MPDSLLSQYFSGVALKTLTAVEANPATSNQHEYNGNKELKRVFGPATSKHRFRARFVYLSESERLTDEGPVTWYDARQNHPTRSEHRLYFPTTKVSRRASAGDLLVIGMLRDNSVVVVVARQGSPIAGDLQRLFGVRVSTAARFSLWQKNTEIPEVEARGLLEAIGVFTAAATASQPAAAPAQRLALVATTMPTDYAAVVAQLQEVSEQSDERGTLFEVGRYESPSGIWEVAIVQVGLGTLYALETVDEAVQRFQPEVLVLIGGAHGLREDLALGDVVVANAVYNVDGEEMEADGFEAPGSSYRILQRALKEAAGTAWLAKKHLPAIEGVQPHVLIAPIVSAVRLVGAPEELRASRPVAIDMEDAGLLSAIDRRSGMEFLILRGIASVGQDRNNRDTTVVSDNVSAFAFQVLSTLELAPVAAERAPARTPAVSSTPQVFIRRFQIRSIRSISEIDWQAPDDISVGWHVLVGVNASGKTTALRCIALALLGSHDAQAFGQRWVAWVQTGSIEGGVTLALRDQDGADITLDWRVSPGNVEDTSPVTSGQAPSGLFSVGYGPFRRFSGGDSEFKERLVSWPRALRHITLFSERGDLADSLGWLRSLYVKQLEAPESRLFGQVKDFINRSSLLPSGTRLAEVSSDRITFKDGNECLVSIEDLSDGFRSVLSLVLDILRHLSDQLPEDALFSPTRAHVIASGVVLIDEIDVHLHPKWQQTIGSWFKRHFPRFQFIVATHSLFVCQSADSVFVLPDPGTTEPGRMLAEVELNQIRFGTVLDGYGTEVFGRGVDESKESRRLSQRLAALNLKQLRGGLTSEEKNEQTNLRAILPTGDILSEPEEP